MDDKASIRGGILDARKARGAREHDGFRARLAELVSATGARRVCCFVGTGSEPDTSEFLAWALAEGIEVLLPRVVDDERMEWVRLGEQGLARGAFGILEPVGAAMGSEAVEAVDLMLVPAAAVDHSGTRLGWGRGYFDRALAGIHPPHRPPVYAVVYETEVRDALPAEPHDVPVDGAVTELAVHRFR